MGKYLSSKNVKGFFETFFENHNALNILEMNIYQNLNFMHKFINNQISSIFSNLKKENT